jgi:hypothetical protein
MRLIKLFVPAAAFAALALFAPHAEAQTMGEYATTVGVASGDSSAFSTSDGGGSRTWGASSLGASFEERAGSASSTGEGFESRAGSMTGGSDPGSRWPTETELSKSGSEDRFGGSSDRFSNDDRFGQSKFTDSDRFPPSAFNDNRMGLDTTYNSK